MARGLAWGLLNSLLLRLGNLGVGILLARLLAPHDFGVYAVGLTVLSVLAAVAELGLTAQLVREGDIERRAPTANTLGLVVSGAMVVSVWISAPAVAVALGSAEATPVIRVLSFSLILSGLSAVPMAALQRRFLQSRQFVADLVSFVLTTVATLVMVEANFGAMSLAWSRLLGQGVTLAILIGYARIVPRIGWDRTVAREMWRFGVPLCAANLLSWVLLNVDYVVVGHLLGATALGIYVLAFNIASWPTSALTQAVRSVALPAFSKRPGTHEPVDTSQPVATATRLLWSAAAPIAAMITVLAGPLVLTVYGRPWGDAVPILAALGIFGSLRTLFDLWATYLVACGATRAVLLVQALWTATLAPAVYIGARVDSLRGVGWAHVIVAVVVVLPAYAVALRRHQVSLSTTARGLVPATLAALAAALVAWMVARQLDASWTALLVGGAAGGVVYLVVGGRGLLRDARAFAPKKRETAPEPVDVAV